MSVHIIHWHCFHLCPGLHAAAKIAILRVLRKIVSLTIFCVARDFSLFFVMLIITKPERVADLTKLRKIVSVTIFCVARDFSLFFVMLIISKPVRVAVYLNKICEIAKNRQPDDVLRCSRVFAVLCHFNNHKTRAICAKPKQLFK